MKKLFSMLLCGAMLVAFSACEQNNEVNGEGGGSHEYVDLGLPSGTLWATCNVGATAPEQSGDYFAWGETERKSYYGWDNLKYNSGGEEEDAYWTKYFTSNEFCQGDVDNKTVLESMDDAARTTLGGDWRTPTATECEELVSICQWEDATINGIKGRKAIGSNGKSIFFPLAGYYFQSRNDGVESLGCYMSATLSNKPDFCNGLCLNYSSNRQEVARVARWYGISVRPVMSKK